LLKLNSRPASLTDRGVWLVSGGAKGVTAQCVIKLARQYRSTFILLGRSELWECEPAWAVGISDDTELKRNAMAALNNQGEQVTPAKIQKEVNALQSYRTITRTLQAVNEAGGQAFYCSADITDRANLDRQLKAVIRQTGPVTAVLHGAGNLADKRIEKKTEQDFEIVYSAKVDGLENLLSCITPEQLDTLVLFSSAAGFYGNSGQSDYALGNEILNKTAHVLQRRYPNCQVLSMNWGPWDGGMVTPQVRALFAERNIEIIHIESGTQMLVDELERRSSSAVQVLVGGALHVPAVSLDPQAALAVHRMQRRLSLEANPFLLDHQIGGHAVLPTVCAMAWMSSSAEQRYPGYTFFRADNYRVLKGIVFDDTLAPEYTVEVKEVDKSLPGQLQVEVMISSKTPQGQLRFHYNARLTLVTALPPTPVYGHKPVYPHTGHNPSNGRDGSALYSDGTLFHGPSFQGVRRILEYSPLHIVLECETPRVSVEAQGQFPVQTFNPFASDVQFQSMVIWSRLFYGAGSLPLRAQKSEHYHSPAAGENFYVTMEVHSHSENSLVANIFAHDASGNIYTRVEGAEVTISKQLNHLFVPAVQ
jgi:NAD(P)-dependent dehydrogenase (short-subunit alcohol dehydrogenase family)